MQITKEIVEYVAHLSRIELNKEEMEKLAVQLTGILDFIDKLKAVDVDKVEPTRYIFPSHPSPLSEGEREKGEGYNNVLREDTLSVSLTNAEALKNAPLKQGNFFVVPKVIE